MGPLDRTPSTLKRWRTERIEIRGIEGFVSSGRGGSKYPSYQVSRSGGIEPRAGN